MSDGWTELTTITRSYFDGGRAVAPDVIVRIRRARLAALLLSDVRLQCVTVRELRPLERQALRVAARLGGVAADDLTAITGVAEPVAHLLIARLANSGMLALEGKARAITTAGHAALVQPTFPEARVETHAFAVLPRTGDVLPAARGGLGGALRLKPSTQAPVPGDLRAVAPYDLLCSAFAADLDRFPPDCVAVESAGAPFPAECGAWDADGEIAVVGGREVARLRVHGAHGNAHGVELDVPSQLVAGWKTLANAFADPLRWSDALFASTGARPARLALEPRGACAWELGLPAEQVRALVRAGVSLETARSFVLGNEVAEVEVAAQLVPLDAEGAAAFLVDLLAARVANDGLPNTPEAHAMAVKGLSFGRVPLPTPDAVRQRLWQLGEYPAVYALRETEDFPRDG